MGHAGRLCGSGRDVGGDRYPRTKGGNRPIRAGRKIPGSVRLWQFHGKGHFNTFLFLVEAPDGEPQSMPETTDIGFWGRNLLPDLAPGDSGMIPLAFKMVSEEMSIPYLDSL